MVTVKQLFNAFGLKLYGDISGSGYVCIHCLPIVVPQGVSFEIQAGEDECVTGHIFVANDYVDKHFEVKWHEGQICAICERQDICSRLETRIARIFYRPEGRAYNPFKILRKRVSVMDKSGFVVSMQNTDWHDCRYTIQFDDGSRFIALWWQMKVEDYDGERGSGREQWVRR